MIRFALKCDRGHRCDSWFQSGAAFDKLHAAGLVTCALCGSNQVEKAVMAPGLVSGQAPGDAPAAGALRRPATRAERALAELRRRLVERSDDVGTAFAREARDMHDGLIPERPIHGQARPEEARELIEDGVPVLPLPFVPRRDTS